MAKNRQRLRDMNPTRALAYCANITANEWSVLESQEALALWAVFRSYILNGFQETDTPVPERIVAVWGRCKDLIDSEAKR